MTDPTAQAEQSQAACAHLHISYTPIDAGQQCIEATEQVPGGMRHIMVECWTCNTCRHQFIPFGKHQLALTTAHAQGRREGLEEGAEEIQKRIDYGKKYRLRDRENLRSGWSGIESGECCKECQMDSPTNPLQVLVGCLNPFQLPERCECHLPFRKVAEESIQQVLSTLAAALRRAQESK